MLLEQLRGLVSEPVYIRGVEYYREGRIKKYQVRPVNDYYYKVDAIVQGSEDYHIEVQIHTGGGELGVGSHCECPYDWEELCKHSVAVVYKFLTENYSEKSMKPKQTAESFKSFNQLEQLSFTVSEEQLTLKYTLKGLVKLSLANFRITFDCPQINEQEKARVRGIIFDFSSDNYSPYYYRYREGNQIIDRLSSFDQLVLAHLRSIQTRKDSDHETIFFAKTSENLQFILTILANREIFLEENKSQLAMGDKISPRGYISGDESSVKVQFDTGAFQDMGVYCPELKYLLTGNVLHPVDISGIEKLPAEITIPPERQGEFLFEVLPRLRQNMRLELSPKLESHKLHVIEPEISLHFDYQQEEVLCEPVININGQTLKGVDALKIVNEAQYTRTPANSREWVTVDQEILKTFTRFFDDNHFLVSARGIILKGQDEIIQFMLAGQRHLPEEWRITSSESFDAFKVTPVVLEPVVELNMDDTSNGDATDGAIDWFEFRVYYNLGGKTYSHKEILQMIRQNAYGDRYIQVGQQVFLIEETEKVDLINKAALFTEGQDAEEYKSELYNLFFYRQLFLNNGIKVTGNKIYDELEGDLSGKNLVEICEFPTGLVGELRHYQQEGFFWLRFLHKYRLGGILADDMGLGKTIQVLTLLKSLPQDTPTLVVCPRSLLYNWAAEIEKFYPGTAYLVYHGAPEEREKIRAEFSSQEIIITTYDIINRDEKALQDFKFYYCVLDEAQHIKNHQTQRSKMIKRIKCNHRLVMTGTPIENGLDELWSIFDFLMPGYLGSKQKFSTRYAAPIKKENDREVLGLLKQKVAPFILRRRKEEVLQELPEKAISMQRVLMTKLQEDTYRAILEQAKEDVMESIALNGFEHSHITVLAALTRLRQVCNHPGLVLPDLSPDVESGKVESLMELVFEAMDSGHKMVIFSQFVKMLKIIERKFQAAGVIYEYLDGSTHDRMERINRFNETPGIAAFLISLKAGGVGINLTSADIVIHVDPWWNPMVENQATDRVHRIGQKKQVMVYKLITAGTVEEKMLLLQNRKKSMFDAIIENNDDPVSSLTWDDIRGMFEL